MKKLLTLFLVLVASIGTMFAWDYERVQIGDLYYNLNATNQTAEVTSQNSSYPYWSTTITTAIIPASVEYNSVTYSVTSIGDQAFRSCTGLTSVTIPNSVTSIGNDAFSGCSGLTSVTIPNSVTSIGNWAFGGCRGLTSVTIPNSVTVIGLQAFHQCSGLTSVTIGNSVTSIGDLAFQDCSGLTSLYVEAGNTVYDSRNNCNAIIETSTNTLIFGCQNTTIPNTVTSIGRGAFYGCSSLTSVTIPNSVTSIGDQAFWDCWGLTSVTIPNSVTNIGDDAFRECSGLTSVTIGNSVTSIGEGAFLGCSGLTSVTIGNSVTSIGEGAFLGCSGLTSVTIGNSVTSIGDYAFSSCAGLTSVTIPNSVTSIGDYAFCLCRSLTSITNYATTPQSINSSVFDGYGSYPGVDKSTCILNVPKESVSLYQAAEVWKKFTNIVGVDVPGEDPEEPIVDVPGEDPEEPIETVEGDYTINYVDKDSQALYNHVVTLYVPVAPAITGFTFVGWQASGMLSDGITLQAVYQADVPSSAPAVYTNPANPAQKLIKNGNVYILTEDKTYTITGQKIK